MSATTAVLRTEARLFGRELGFLFWIVLFPTVLLVILGLVPSFREPADDLGGARVIDVYTPVSVLLLDDHGGDHGDAVGAGRLPRARGAAPPAGDPGLAGHAPGRPGRAARRGCRRLHRAGAGRGPPRLRRGPAGDLLGWVLAYGLGLGAALVTGAA